MDIQQIFEQIAAKMQAEVQMARSAMNHSALKGTAFEETFRKFLRDHLPARLDVSTGQIVDSKGGISKQLDAIISDAGKTPILFQDANTRILPVECVYAVIEVKARLSLSEVDSCFENMLSVRRLQKLAYQPEVGLTRSVIAYGRLWPIWPINYYVFAYDSVDLISVHSRLQKLEAKHAVPPAERIDCSSRIDMVCVLDKGVILNRLNNGIFSALSTPDSTRFICRTPKSLLLFYVLASQYFNQTWLPDFRFLDYIGNMSFDDIAPAAPRKRATRKAR